MRFIAPPLLLFALVHCQRPAAPASAPTESTLAKQILPSRSTPLATPVSFIGVLVARQSLEVVAPTAGRLAKVRAEIGQRVQSGELLIEYDSQVLRAERAMAAAAVEVAAAEVSRASIDLEQAQVRLERVKTLYQGNRPAVSGDEWERTVYQQKGAVAHQASSQASLREKRARLLQVDAQLTTTEVRAPFAGQVAARFVETGAAVTTGAPLLRLLDATLPLLRFAVAEKDRVAPGQRVCVEGSDASTRIQAIVERIAPEVDAASRLVMAEAVLPKDAALKANLHVGALVRVFLHTDCAISEKLAEASHG